MGISEATFYNWKKKYEGLGVSELQRLKQLEEENLKLKQLVDQLDMAYRVGIRRACSVIGIQRTSYYCKSRRDDRVLTARIHEIAAARVQYGY